MKKKKPQKETISTKKSSGIESETSKTPKSSDINANDLPNAENENSKSGGNTSQTPKVAEGENNQLSNKEMEDLKRKIYLQADYELSGKYVKEIDILKNEIIQLNQNLQLKKQFIESVKLGEQQIHSVAEQYNKNYVELLKTILSCFTTHYENQLPEKLAAHIKELLVKNIKSKMQIKANSGTCKKLKSLINEQLDSDLIELIEIIEDRDLDENDMIFVTNNFDLTFEKGEFSKEIYKILTAHDKL